MTESSLRGPDIAVSSNSQTSLGALSRFDPYVCFVEALAQAALHSRLSWDPALEPSDLLDGQTSATLRETIPLRVRRERGTFFSSSDLRTAALAPWPNGTESSGPILDPSLGAGDLLIEAARRLPIDRDLTKTLRLWGRLLHGRDVEPTFVRLAKARLVLFAVERGATANIKNSTCLDDVLPEIKVGDGLDLLNRGWLGHIVMNPPFTYDRAPADTSWASGRTSVAAMFLAAAVEGARPGTRLTAILPDVIRAGSRYDRLRAFVEARLDVSAAEAYGRFDAWTDIDVFILRGVVVPSAAGASATTWWCLAAGERLSDRFDIHVGPVVPHRDPELGPTYPYLHARAIPLRDEFDVSHAERRGFQKRLFAPPFVVIRRTSRPGDKSRGMGTVISGTGSVLVENHLIVLKPKDGSLDACRRVIVLLDSTRARQWLDERIRCRHLTLRAIGEMPCFDS